MKKVLILSFIVSLMGFAGYSQSIDKEKLDAYFDALAENNRFMGSVAISHNNKLIYTKSVGYADVEQGLKANEKTRYRIASISKIFTSVLIFKAVEENKINLDQTIDKYFPAIQNAGKITIRHLLYHRSGISEHPDEHLWHTQTKSQQETIDMIAVGGSDFEPGTDASYSNPNYVLLAYILERIYQRSFSEILEEKIIQPLKLQNTYTWKKININDNECYSYSYSNGWEKEPETYLLNRLGSGGIVSTPADLNVFSQALFTGKLLSESNMEQMKTFKDGYSAGVANIRFDNKIGFGGAGRIDGFCSWFGNFADDNISFAYTANGVNIPLEDVQSVILSAIYNKPFEIPQYITLHLTEEDLDKYLGVYTTDGDSTFEMTITKVGNKLFAQGTGIPPLPLEPTKKDIFEFFPVSIIIEFNPTDKTMIMKQGNTVMTLERKD